MALIPIDITAKAGVNKWVVVGIAVILIGGFAYYYYTVEEAAKLKALPSAGYNTGRSISGFFQGLFGADNTNVNPAGG